MIHLLKEKNPSSKPVLYSCKIQHRCKGTLTYLLVSDSASLRLLLIEIGQRGSRSLIGFFIHCTQELITSHPEVSPVPVTVLPRPPSEEVQPPKSYGSQLVGDRYVPLTHGNMGTGTKYQISLPQLELICTFLWRQVGF